MIAADIVRSRMKLEGTSVVKGTNGRLGPSVIRRKNSGDIPCEDKLKNRILMRYNNENNFIKQKYTQNIKSRLYFKAG